MVIAYTAMAQDSTKKGSLAIKRDLLTLITGTTLTTPKIQENQQFNKLYKFTKLF